MGGRRSTISSVAEMAAKSSALPHAARRFGAVGGPSSSLDKVG